jgi:hypothetical protein
MRVNHPRPVAAVTLAASHSTAMEDCTMDDPTDDDALTVDELIDRLEKIRAVHGGTIPVFMSDCEPVCRIEFLDYEFGPHVIITDRYQDTDG